MKRLKVKVNSLFKVKENFFLLSFKSSYLAKKAYPGQFLQIKVESPGLILRRPFSVHKVEKDKVFILFKIRGKGTTVLSQYKKGDFLDVIGPLGRGFNYQLSTINYQLSILVGGGIGIAPLVFLAQKIGENRPDVFLGARSKEEILCKRDFEKLGCKVFIATEDGSSGFKGKITDLLRDRLQATGYRLQANIYACGPKDMFLKIHKLIKNYPNINCQASFEQFMGCGIGLCRGCIINTFQGYKRVCKDGPVFKIKDVF